MIKAQNLRVAGDPQVLAKSLPGQWRQANPSTAAVPGQGFTLRHFGHNCSNGDGLLIRIAG
jgi:hypothetical protein